MARPFQFHLPPYDGSRGLTPEQRQAVNCDQAIFQGVAGTGKTTVAIWRILKNRDDILLTYTRLLSAAIGHLVGNKKNSNIWGAHQWYFNRCGGARLEKDIKTHTVLQTLRQNNVKLGRVIVDEGQDLDETFFRAIKEIAQRVSIGADDGQQLYDVDTDLNILKNIFTHNTTKLLTRNFRNRYKIYNFARQFIPEDTMAKDTDMLKRLKRENNGGTVEIHIKNRDSDVYSTVKNIIDTKKRGNIGILLSETDDVDSYHEELEQQGIEHSAYHNGIFWKDKRYIEKNLLSVLITTFKSAKGLEFDTVVMPEFDRAVYRDRKQYYVGATRARDDLYILCRSMPDLLNDFDSSTYIKPIGSSSTSDDYEDLPF
jgi:DNA helicase IV